LRVRERAARLPPGEPPAQPFLGGLFLALQNEVYFDSIIKD
jgi:hypothetical protein